MGQERAFKKYSVCRGAPLLPERRVLFYLPARRQICSDQATLHTSCMKFWNIDEASSYISGTVAELAFSDVGQYRQNGEVSIIGIPTYRWLAIIPRSLIRFRAVPLHYHSFHNASSENAIAASNTYRQSTHHPARLTLRIPDKPLLHLPYIASLPIFTSPHLSSQSRSAAPHRLLTTSPPSVAASSTTHLSQRIHKPTRSLCFSHISAMTSAPFVPPPPPPDKPSEQQYTSPSVPTPPPPSYYPHATDATAQQPYPPPHDYTTQHPYSPQEHYTTQQPYPTQDHYTAQQLYAPKPHYTPTSENAPPYQQQPNSWPQHPPNTESERENKFCPYFCLGIVAAMFLGPCSFITLCIPDLRERMGRSGTKSYTIGATLGLVVEIIAWTLIVVFHILAFRSVDSVRGV